MISFLYVYYMKIKVGDKVKWDGGPKELSVARYGTVVDIHKGVAQVYNDYHGKTKLVPVNILKKE